jgi:hypothetical protein
MSQSRRSFIQTSITGLAALSVASRGNAQGKTDGGKSEMHYLSVAEAGRLIKQRKLSPVEYAQAILKRIDAVEPFSESVPRMVEPQPKKRFNRKACPEPKRGNYTTQKNAETPFHPPPRLEIVSQSAKTL